VKIIAALPNCEVHGGVRRFIEVGNRLVDLGHEYHIISQRPAWSGWMTKNFPVHDFSGPSDCDVFLGSYSPDLASLGADPLITAKQKWIWVVHDRPAMMTQYQTAAKSGLWTGLMVNNHRDKVTYADCGIPVHVVEGGVNIDTFTPKLTVGYQDRTKGKGGAAIRKALEGLDHVELVKFENFVGDQLVAAYRSLDWFVSWENEGGWANMAAEALACGTRVVTNGKNCEPFMDLCSVTDNLAHFFLAEKYKMDKWGWGMVVKRLLWVFGR